MQTSEEEYILKVKVAKSSKVKVIKVEAIEVVCKEYK